MEVKREIIKAANSIRSKYKAMKRGLAFQEAETKKYFDPVIKPLKKLVDLTKEYDNRDYSPIKVKKLKKMEEEMKEEDEEKMEGIESEEENHPVEETPLNELAPDEVFSYEGEDFERQQRQWSEYLQTLGPLTREYFSGMYLDPKNTYDHKFGVHLDPDTSSIDELHWKLGNEEIEFDRFDHVSVPGIT